MFKPDECLLVMGRRGCGKSYLAKRLQELWPRRVIIDSLNEYTEGTRVRTFTDFCAYLELYKREKTRAFVLIFQFDVEEELPDEVFNQILKLCYHFKDIQVVIEEVQHYATPHYLPKWLKHCLLTGRHQKLSLLFTTQRPGELNKTILSQCAHVFCGSLIDGNDINYVSGFLRQDGAKLVSLPERQFIYFSKDGIRQISNDI